MEGNDTSGDDDNDNYFTACKSEQNANGESAAAGYFLSLLLYIRPQLFLPSDLSHLDAAEISQRQNVRQRDAG